jgi:hypothetical protein
MHQKIPELPEFKDVSEMGLGDLIYELSYIPYIMVKESSELQGVDYERTQLYKKRTRELKGEINQREEEYRRQ